MTAADDDTTAGPLFTTAELAAYLRVSTWQVLRWVECGVLPGVVRLGPQTLRYDQAAIARWVQAGGVSRRSTG